MYRIAQSCGVWIVGITMLAVSAWGQEAKNAERGFQPEHSYDLGEIDHVNNFNGNLVVSIPIGQRYQVSPVLSYQFTLTWNSNVWDLETDQQGFKRSYPNRISNAGIGWYFGLGRVIQPGQPGNTTAYPVYVGPDGRKVRFYETLHPEDEDDLETGDTYDPLTQQRLYSRDGSYLRAGRSCSAGQVANNCDWWIDFPNGVSQKFRAGDGLLTEMLDPYLNWVHVTIGRVGSTTTWTVSDPFRTHTITLVDKVIEQGDPQYPAVVVPMVTSAALAAFDGQTATYSFSYPASTTKIYRPDDPIQDDCYDDLQNGTVPCRLYTTFLSGLSGPQSWSLSMPLYEQSQSSSVGLQSGILKKVTLPTAGAIGWTYQLYQTPTGESGLQSPKTYRSVGVGSRTTYAASGAVEGTWTYLAESPTIAGRTCDASPYPVTTLSRSVVTPLGDKTVRYFTVFPCGLSGYPGLEEIGLPYSSEAADIDAASGAKLSEQVFDCTANPSDPGNPTGCSLTRSSYVKYDWDNTVTFGDEHNQRLVYSKTIFADDGNRWQDMTYSNFDGLGHYRQTATNGNFDAGNVHTSFTNFNSGQSYPGGFSRVPPGAAWLLGLYDRIDETEGGDTSRRLFAFQSLTGFLDCARTLASGTTPGTHDLLTRYTLGNDVDGHSGYVTQERFYGGDRQSIGTSGACSDGTSPEYTVNHSYRYGARKTSQFAGVSWKSLDLTIDAKTGQPSQSFDPAGMETDFEYDALGRMTESRPLAKAGFSKDAWTKYEYVLSSSSSVTTRTCPSVSGTCSGSNDLTRQVASIDGLGRVWQEQTLLPDGTLNKRITTYDAMGHKATVSTWVANGASASNVTTYSSYDPFGRPASVTAPDNKVTSFARSGDRLVTTTQSIALALNGSETPVTRKETFDRQGRIFRVEEYSNPAAPSTYIKTDYSYDEAGRLVKVCQNAAGATCGQTRLFTYDNRGFLTSETHPEKGASGNGSVTYFCYDSRGHAGQRNDGDNIRILAYSFDVAERLTTVRSRTNGQTCGDASGTLLKQFTYESSTGKLASAMRRNDLTFTSLTPSSADYQVTETYQYSGRMGRASKRTTQLAVGGVNKERWELSPSYDELGAVVSLDYPRCFDATCGTGDGTPARAIAFTRTHGALTAVPGWATSITYHPNRLVAKVTHTNGNPVGTVDTIANDPKSIPRPASFSYDPGDTDDATVASGTYAYDGAGNVKSIGSDLFRYDKVSRLLEGQLNSVSPTGDQAYDFDLYGNLTRTTTQIGGGGPTYQELPVVLVPPVTGNPINRLGGTATYDAAGNQTSWSGQTYGYDLFNAMRSLDTGAERWVYVYTADDERLMALLDNSSNALVTWTIRDLGNDVVTRDERFPQGYVPPPVTPGPCPGPNGIFCDGFESATWGAWSGGSGSVTRRTTDYIHRDGQLLAAYGLDGGNVENFSLDHLGTPRLVTNELGTVVASHTYFPFGQEATPIDQDLEVRKFTAHERDLQTTTANSADDLDYMHARFRSPGTARFLSVDAHSGSASAPQSWNRFAYGRANPLKLIDPTGNDVILANRPTDAGWGHHAFIIVQLTGANRQLFRSSAKNGRLYLSGGPGVIEGEKWTRLVKWSEEHVTAKTQLFYVQPKNQTKEEFERNVIAAWESYVDGSALYQNFAMGRMKNSNSLASGVLDAAGAGDAKPSSWDMNGFNPGWNNPVALTPTHVSAVFNELSLGPVTSSWTAPYDDFFAGQAILEGIQFVPGRSH